MSTRKMFVPPVENTGVLLAKPMTYGPKFRAPTPIEKLKSGYSVHRDYKIWQLSEAFKQGLKSRWIACFPMTPREFQYFTKEFLRSIKDGSSPNCCLVYGGTRIKSHDDDFTEMWVDTGYDVIFSSGSKIIIIDSTNPLVISNP